MTLPTLNLLRPANTFSASRINYIKNSVRQMNTGAAAAVPNMKTPNTFSMSNIYSNPTRQCGGCGK